MSDGYFEIVEKCVSFRLRRVARAITAPTLGFRCGPILAHHASVRPRADPGHTSDQTAVDDEMHGGIRIRHELYKLDNEPGVRRQQ